MSSDNIISVTESSFEYDVIAYSQNTPVVVDFWAEWCKPCKVLTPILERINREADGSFRLAKVDVDENPNLALRYNVHSIPTVMAFSQGRKVSDFTGVIPEARIMEFIRGILPPSPSDLLGQKGESLFAARDFDGARQAFEEALELDPNHPASLLGMMKIYLMTGQYDLAQSIYHSFPASQEFNAAEELVPLIKAMDDFSHQRLPEETDLDLAFNNAIHLAMRGNIYASIDGLLDILRQDKKYRRGRARSVLLALLDLLDPQDEQTRRYRAELASILF
ncbi:MAG TPA: thioredoxin [Anaerolineaceae bacterium]|nr:thioredoxin [Anaerolineaceae bacterium]